MNSMEAHDALMEESRQLREEARRVQDEASRLLAKQNFCGRGYFSSLSSDAERPHSRGVRQAG